MKVLISVTFAALALAMGVMTWALATEQVDGLLATAVLVSLCFCVPYFLSVLWFLVSGK